jgi:hypothetical protein
MDDEVQEHQNPYPAPPAHYVRYTDHHLDLLALLRARPDEPQDVVLADKTDVPPWALGELEPPRADWILEDGGTVEMFGELWNVRAGLAWGGGRAEGADGGTAGERGRHPVARAVRRDAALPRGPDRRHAASPPPLHPILTCAAQTGGRRCTRSCARYCSRTRRSRARC